jgi:hypothetical protein
MKTLVILLLWVIFPVGQATDITLKAKLLLPPQIQFHCGCFMVKENLSFSALETRRGIFTSDVFSVTVTCPYDVLPHQLTKNSLCRITVRLVSAHNYELVDLKML